MKKFNFEELIWFVVLMLINMSIFYLLKNSKMSFYIGDKMIKYMYITILMICILIFFQVKNIFTPKSSVSIMIKILPILFALIVGFIAVTNQTKIVHNELFESILRKADEPTDFDVDLNSKIIIDDDNIEILDDIKNNNDKYLGKTIQFSGFICKEKYLKNDQFLLGRVVITCCGADSKIVGFLAHYDKTEDLKENENVSVEGKIGYTTINDEDGTSHEVPIINIYNIKIEKNSPRN